MFSLSLLLICACASTSGRDPKRAALHLKNGTALLAQGQYPAAMSELLTAERLDPDNPVTHNNLGLSYLVRDRINKAEQHLKKALKLDPKYTDARNNLGRVYIQQKRYPAAIEELKVAVQDLTYPHPQRPLYNLGEAYFYTGNYEQAQKVLLEALQYRREDCLTMTLYGRTLFELKNYSMASQALDEATRTCAQPSKEEPYYFSALSYLKLGQSNQAYARLKECLENFPKGRYAGRAQSLMREIR